MRGQVWAYADLAALDHNCDPDGMAYTLFVGMDEENRRDMLRILRSDPEHKVRLLLDWTDHPREIDDPWYTDDYDTTYVDVRRGCEALFKAII